MQLYRQAQNAIIGIELQYALFPQVQENGKQQMNIDIERDSSLNFVIKVTGEGINFEIFVEKDDTKNAAVALAIGLGKLVIGNQSMFGVYLKKEDEKNSDLIRDPRNVFVNHNAIPIVIGKEGIMTRNWKAICNGINAVGKGQSLEEALGWLVIGAKKSQLEISEPLNNEVCKYIQENEVCTTHH